MSAIEKCHWCGDAGHNPDKCDWVTDEEVKAEKRGRAAHKTECEHDAWQPIKTAPRDWTDVILYCPEDDDGFGAKGVCQGWFSMADGGFNCWMAPDGPRSPSHWMPLPEPPSC